MLNTVIAALSGALIAAAGPAFADVAKPVNDAPVELSVASAAAPVSTGSAAKPTRYCVHETLTGSRLMTRACYSRADWMSRGFDPLAK